MQKEVGFRYSSLNKKQKDIRYSIILNTYVCTTFQKITVFSQKILGFKNQMTTPTLFTLAF